MQQRLHGKTTPVLPGKSLTEPNLPCGVLIHNLVSAVKQIGAEPQFDLCLLEGRTGVVLPCSQLAINDIAKIFIKK